jgi:membrane-bound metal-dependent hydrolase YbcI (DUF457 family)
MKGISHFVTGVTVASCFPWSVEAAQAGNPLYFILGGAMGLIPDTLDFKFYRFFYRHDVYVAPDPANPDPQVIANAIARAIDTAAREHREVRIKLGTIKLGTDYWQQYIVKFDTEARQVQVKFGPVVNTGQAPVPRPDGENSPVGVARFASRVNQTYEAVTTVDIFDGPSFSFEPDAQGIVALYFLPWHRTWSHSLVTGLALGVLGGLIWGWRAGVVMPLAFSAHVMEDQLGHMGSNLFWPLTRKRFPGMKRMHATDALPNFLAVWACMLVMFWNLYFYAAEHAYRIAWWQVVLYGAVVPLGAFGALYALLTRHKAKADVVIDISREEVDAMMG